MARTSSVLAVLLGCVNLLHAYSSGSLVFVHEPLDIPQRGAFNVQFHYNFAQEQHVVVDILSEGEVHGSGGITVPAGSGARVVRVNWWSHVAPASQVDMRIWAVDEKHYAADPTHAWNDHTLSSHFTGVRIAPQLRVAMSSLVLLPSGQPASKSTRTLAAQTDAECRQACHADGRCLAVGFSPSQKECAVFGEVPKVAAGNSDVVYSFKETEDPGGLASDPVVASKSDPVVASKRRLLQAPTPAFQEETFRYKVTFWTLEATPREITLGLGKSVRYKFGLNSLNNQSNVDVEDPCFKPYVHIIQTSTQPTWDDIANIYSKGGPGGPALAVSQQDPDGTILGQQKNGGPLLSVVKVPKEAIQGFHNDMIETIFIFNGPDAAKDRDFIQTSQLSFDNGNDPILNVDTQNPTDNRAIIIPVYTCKYSTQEHAGMVLCVILLVASVVLSGKFIGH